MATIGDPADAQFNPPNAVQVQALIDYFDRWPAASNMRSGQPKLLTDEIKRLRGMLDRVEVLLHSRDVRTYEDKWHAIQRLIEAGHV